MRGSGAELNRFHRLFLPRHIEYSALKPIILYNLYFFRAFTCAGIICFRTISLLIPVTVVCIVIWSMYYMGYTIIFLDRFGFQIVIDGLDILLQAALDSQLGVFLEYL